MVGRGKDKDYLANTHSPIQETLARGSEERHLCIGMGSYARRLQRTLWALSSEAVSGLTLFWKPGWGKWLGIVILTGGGTGIGGLIFHALVHLITSLLLGQLVGFLPPEPFDAIPGAWIWNRDSARLWLLPIIVATGGLISGLLTCWARNPDGTEAKGLRGTDAAIRAWHEGVGILKRVPVVVMLASSALIGSGGSAGVEGPSAQIGLGIGSGIADLFHLNPDERRLVQAWGMGALVAAMFHSPVGGTIFAGEILRRRGANLKVIPGALISSIIASSLNGWGPTLIWPSHVSATWPHLFWTSAVLGLVCGVTGRLYAFALSWTKQTFKKAKVLEPLKPTLGGLLVGLLGLVYPQVLGLGNGWLQVTISLPMSFPLWIIIVLPIAKLLATSLCVGSGGTGGIFGPGMIIGGLLGAAYWSVLHILPLPAGVIADTPAIFVMVGMIALLGPIARTPVAVTVMVMNLTGNVSFVPAAVCALIVSSWVVKGTTIYPSQP